VRIAQRAICGDAFRGAITFFCNADSLKRVGSALYVDLIEEVIPILEAWSPLTSYRVRRPAYSHWGSLLVTYSFQRTFVPAFVTPVFFIGARRSRNAPVLTSSCPTEPLYAITHLILITQFADVRLPLRGRFAPMSSYSFSELTGSSPCFAHADWKVPLHEGIDSKRATQKATITGGSLRHDEVRTRNEYHYPFAVHH
jgi:hypothetical protein